MGFEDQFRGSQDDIRERVSEGTVVVVGHGGSLRAFLCDALDAPVSSMSRFQLENASLSAIDYTDHRTWVKLVNDTSHL